jgi:uncharacterized tellurite resistance protein B-like protein
MGISDLFESNEHRNNIAHFAAIVNLAAVDGTINAEEEHVIKRLADKLDISLEEYKSIIKNIEKYSLSPQYSIKKRQERLYDLFKTIYADYYMNAKEQKLVLRYAMELGYTYEKAKEIIQNSVRIFGGRIDFEEYRRLING